MRIILFIFCLGFLSCASLKKANENKCIDTTYGKKSIYCLRDMLIGGDIGGTWEQIGTTPQDISSLLIGDNPCIEWSDKACGQYEIMYIVGDACCRDTSIVRPLKCCPIINQSFCN